MDGTGVNVSFRLPDGSTGGFSILFNDPIMIPSLNLGNLSEVVRRRWGRDGPLHTGGIPRVMADPPRIAGLPDVVHEYQNPIASTMYPTLEIWFMCSQPNSAE